MFSYTRRTLVSGSGILVVALLDRLVTVAESAVVALKAEYRRGGQEKLAHTVGHILVTAVACPVLLVVVVQFIEPFCSDSNCLCLLLCCCKRSTSYRARRIATVVLPAQQEKSKQRFHS